SDELYEQAGTYGQLGTLARDRRQWEQAEQYYRKALEIFKEYKDVHPMEIALRNLSLLWKEAGNDIIPQNVAETLGISPDEAKELLEKANE
ncbi:tetratricopeptide repeat protein, partial [Methanolacinia paynteri]|uniref:tetratricopeptide repeat protein n=1 Tax=Methanolacinia paynteri TaxID=230356 RepID=UPI00064F90E8